jgi:hypothetical protein
MKQNKHRKVLASTAIVALGLSVLTVGCEREVAHTEDTKVKSDGTAQTKEKTVTENPDGTVTKTETKKTDKP